MMLATILLGASIASAAPATSVVFKGHQLACPVRGKEVQRSIEEERRFKKRVSFEKLLKEGRGDELYDRITKILRDEPGNYVAMVEKVLFEIEDYPLPPDTHVPRIELGDAIAPLIAAHRLNASYYKTYLNLAIPIYFVGNPVEDAFALLDCALKLNPDIPDAGFAYVSPLASSGRYEEAYAKLKLEISKGYVRPIEAADAAVMLVVNVSRLDDADTTRRREIATEACGWVAELKAKDPKNWRMARNHAICLSTLTDFTLDRVAGWTEALREMRETDKITDAPPYFEATVEGTIGEYGKCVAHATEGLGRKRSKFRADLHSLRAFCQMEQGNRAQAWTDLKAGLSENLKRNDGSFNFPDPLIYLGSGSDLHSEVRAFLDSLDGDKVPQKEAWVCALEVMRKEVPWRPKGKEVLAWAKQCRPAFAKINDPYQEGLFLADVYDLLLEDKLIKEAWAVQDELMKRERKDVAGSIYRDVVKRKIKFENDEKSALAIIERMGRGSAEGKLTLAWLRFWQERYPEASRALKESNTSDLESDSAFHHLSLAKNLANQRGSHKEALEFAEKAYKLSPTADNLLAVVGTIDDWKGHRAALRYIKDHLDLKTYEPTNGLYRYWAYLLDKNGQVKESLEKLKLADARRPNDAVTLINLATTYAKDFKDCASARPFIERAADNVTDTEQESFLLGLMLKCGLPSLTINNVYKRAKTLR